MSQRCQVSGAVPGFGNQISHSHVRTSRRFNLNIQRKRYWLPREHRWIRLTSKRARQATRGPRGSVRGPAGRAQAHHRVPRYRSRPPPGCRAPARGAAPRQQCDPAAQSRRHRRAPTGGLPPVRPLAHPLPRDGAARRAARHHEVVLVAARAPTRTTSPHEESPWPFPSGASPAATPVTAARNGRQRRWISSRS